MLSKTDQKTDLKKNNKKKMVLTGADQIKITCWVSYLTTPITFNFDHKEYA